jgi:hypothetical protein
LDQRLPLFPFLVSLGHDLVGVRISNAFLANGLLLFAGLFMVFLSVRRRFGTIPAVTAQIFLLTNPLVLWCASSGGLDLLGLVLLGATFWAGYVFATRPEASSLRDFLIVGTLYSYVRQESVVIFALVLLASLFLVAREGKLSYSISRWLGILPLVFTPLLLDCLCGGHGNGYKGYLENVRLLYGKTPFALSYLPQHLFEFARAFFNPSLDAVYSGGLHILGAIGVLVAIWKVRANFIWLLLVVPGVLAHFFFICCFIFGEPYAVPIVALFSLTPLLLLQISRSKKWELSLLACGLLLFALRLPVAIKERLQYTAFEAKQAVGTLEALQKFSTPENSLFVFEVPYFILNAGRAAIGPENFRDHWKAIHDEQEAGRIGKIFFVDGYPPNAISPIKQLAKNFNTRDAASWKSSDSSGRILEIMGLKQ